MFLWKNVALRSFIENENIALNIFLRIKTQSEVLMD